MSNREQSSPKDEIDYGTGEGPAYGGFDADAPVFIPDAGNATDRKHHEHKSANSESFRNMRKDAWNRIVRVIEALFSGSSAWSAVASVVMAIATVFYTVYAHRQWKAMSGQIEVMRDANNLTKQALDGSDATLTKTLKKMQEQTEATDRLKVEAMKQAAQAERTADYAKQALADNKAALHLEESPWISVLGIVSTKRSDGSETHEASQTNAGKTPAFKVHGVAEGTTLPASALPPKFIFNEAQAKGYSIVLPNQPKPYNIPIAGPEPPLEVAARKAGITHTYIGVALWYTDYWGTKHFDTFCQYFDPETQRWVARKPDCED